MGNRSSTNPSSLPKQKHSRLGLIEILNHTTEPDNQNEQVIKSQEYYLSRSDYNSWRQNLLYYTHTDLFESKQVNRNKIRIENNGKLQPLVLNQRIKQTMFLPISCKVKKQGYCGGFNNLEIIYPNYCIVLREQIRSRWEVEKFYTQSEIWYLLYNLILLERYLEPTNIKIGNVHPNNILMDQSTGIMKIITSLSLPNQKQNFNRLCESQLEDVYLAPEQIDLDCLKRCTYPTGINKNLAEIFSIGMTVLEAGTLHLSTSIYDRGPYRINHDKLKQNIGMFRSRYGVHLSNIIEGMLAIKQKSRRTSQQIYELLNPHENDILNLQPFTEKIGRNNRKIESSYSYISSQSQSVMNNSISVQNSNHSGVFNSKIDMQETKVLGSYPQTPFLRTKPDQMSRKLPINFQDYSRNINLHKMNQSEKLNHEHYSSPRIVKTSYTK